MSISFFNLKIFDFFTNFSPITHSAQLPMSLRAVASAAAGQGRRATNGGISSRRENAEYKQRVDPIADGPDRRSIASADPLYASPRSLKEHAWSVFSLCRNYVGVCVCVQSAMSSLNPADSQPSSLNQVSVISHSNEGDRADWDHQSKRRNVASQLVWPQHSVSPHCFPSFCPSDPPVCNFVCDFYTFLFFLPS